MQSKTSFFNRAVLRKDITRFAPIWGGYTLCALVFVLLTRISAGDYDLQFYMAQSYNQYIMLLALVNCGYALVVAQALFGDLYSTRSCYALHAMPLRRETWYVTHVVAGLLFALAPNLLISLAAIPTLAGSCVVKAWMIPVYTMLASSLQYIFFFGVAVLCSFFAGNRLGMLAFYGIGNLGAVLGGLLVEVVYAPMLFGVSIASSRYTPFSPLARMSGFGQGNPMDMLFEFEDFHYLRWLWEQGDMSEPLRVHFSVIPAFWGYYAICAAVGLALLVVSIQLYRNRQLECAGDFLAFRWLEPVFMAFFTIAVGAVFQMAYATFSIDEGYGFFIPMAVGLVLGWFGGKMLLERTTRVFRKGNLPGLAVVAAFMALTLGLTWLDPLDFEGWIPKAHEVASVSFSDYFGPSGLELKEPAEIQDVLTLHKMALDQHLELDCYYRELKEGVNEDEATEADYRYAPSIWLTYTMKDGKIVIRHYNVWLDTDAGQLTKKFFSSPRLVLENDPNFKLDEATELYVNGIPFSDHATAQELQSLWAALYADCEAGTMARDGYYHTGYFQRKDRYGLPGSRNNRTVLDLSIGGERMNLWMSVFPDSENTINWLTDRGILEELEITVIKDQPLPAVG